MLFYIPECKEVTSGVIEYAVEYDPDVSLMAFPDKILEVFVVAKTAVKLFVIGGLVTMSFGFKEGTDVDRVASDAFNVVDPGQQLRQPVDNLGIFVYHGVIKQPDGVYMIKYRFIIPGHAEILLFHLLLTIIFYTFW